jgi:hypothetical protein
MKQWLVFREAVTMQTWIVFAEDEEKAKDLCIFGQLIYGRELGATYPQVEEVPLKAEGDQG